MAPNTVKINSNDVHCTEMAKLLDPLLKSGVVSNETIFAADFAKKYGGANDKILMMPGPTWYAGEARPRSWGRGRSGSRPAR